MIPKKRSRFPPLSMLTDFVPFSIFFSGAAVLNWKVYSRLCCSVSHCEYQPQRGWSAALGCPLPRAQPQPRALLEEGLISAALGALRGTATAGAPRHCCSQAASLLDFSGMSFTGHSGIAFPRWYFWATIAAQVCPLNALLRSGIAPELVVWSSSRSDLKHIRKHFRTQLLV